MVTPEGDYRKVDGDADRSRRALDPLGQELEGLAVDRAAQFGAQRLAPFLPELRNFIEYSPARGRIFSRQLAQLNDFLLVDQAGQFAPGQELLERIQAISGFRVTAIFDRIHQVERRVAADLGKPLELTFMLQFLPP